MNDRPRPQPICDECGKPCGDIGELETPWQLGGGLALWCYCERCDHRSCHAITFGCEEVSTWAEAGR